MKAVILAGGQGTRLRPYTLTIPKPLLPLGRHPVLEIVLRQLAHAGCSEAVITVAYRANLLRAFFGEGEDVGLRLSYLVEEPPLGTAGALGRLRDWADEPLLVVNGDLLTDMDYGAIVRHHMQRKATTTVGVVKRQVALDFGLVEMSEAGQLTGYREKPTLDHHVSMGVNVVDPTALDLIGDGEKVDMPDLHLRALAKGRNVECFVADCTWLDIGRPDDYERAVEAFESQPQRFLPELP